NLAGLSATLQLQLDAFGVIGDDAAGAELSKILRAFKPSLALHAFVDPERPTTLKTRFMAGAQHQLLRVDEEKTHALSPQMEETVWTSIQEQLSSFDALILQDYA